MITKAYENFFNAIIDKYSYSIKGSRIEFNPILIEY